MTGAVETIPPRSSRARAAEPGSGSRRSPSGAPAPARSYTIDELAARTGLPSRTIRFYQTMGALPSPPRRGRIAVYGDEHVDRLRLITMLQDRGLRLSAIVDLVRQGHRSSLSVNQWLGLDERLRASWTDDSARTVDGDDLRRQLGDRRSDILARLVEAGLIRPLDGSPTGAGGYEVPSPALLALVLRMEEAGVDLPTAAGAGAILRRSLHGAADDLVRYFLGHIGHGFGRRADPEELSSAVEVLRPLGVEAVRIIFAHEMERALGATVAGSTTRPRHARGRRPRAVVHSA